jgi:hypothetical protein
LHYGNAVFGAAATAGELNALGQDLNFLFRMERLAAAQGFPHLLSDAARRQISGEANSKPLGVFSLKGFEGEFPFFSR